MTLVVDASVVAELLLGTERGRAATALVRDELLLAPQHLTAEVASVIRAWSLSGHLTDEQAIRACAEFAELDIEQIPMANAVEDVWRLRHNLTAYDAMYVVLARALGCRLLTLDARLAAPAPDCAVASESE